MHTKYKYSFTAIYNLRVNQAGVNDRTMITGDGTAIDILNRMQSFTNLNNSGDGGQSTFSISDIKVEAIQLPPIEDWRDQYSNPTWGPQ